MHLHCRIHYDCVDRRACFTDKASLGCDMRRPKGVIRPPLVTRMCIHTLFLSCVTRTCWLRPPKCAKHPTHGRWPSSKTRTGRRALRGYQVSLFIACLHLRSNSRPRLHSLRRPRRRSLRPRAQRAMRGIAKAAPLSAPPLPPFAVPRRASPPPRARGGGAPAARGP
jgi:hypothetical protein